MTTLVSQISRHTNTTARGVCHISSEVIELMKQKYQIALQVLLHSNRSACESPLMQRSVVGRSPAVAHGAQSPFRADELTWQSRSP